MSIELVSGDKFQSAKDWDERRQAGQHYTSEIYILRCIEPLFLNDLRSELQSINSLQQLKEYHKKISAIKILEPASGCGNFIIIAYRELRRIEHTVLAKLKRLGCDITGLISVSLSSFYGIELDASANEVAKTSMMAIEVQMNSEFSREVDPDYVHAPLSDTFNIITANALLLDWSEIVSPSLLSYIVGNPPFIGKVYQTDDQKRDVMRIFGDITHRAKSMDYVCCWFIKSLDVMKQNKNIRTALVSTNSITQGEMVEPLWGHMLKEGIKIQFAHRTFTWGNESSGEASVCCVIVGFGFKSLDRYIIYDYQDKHLSIPTKRSVNNITPYLTNGDSTLVHPAHSPLSAPYVCLSGNCATDDGLICTFTEQDCDNWVSKEPYLRPFFKKMLGAYEFINNKNRYCLWLKDEDSSIWGQSQRLREILEEVAKFRLKSKNKTTRGHSKTPHLFVQNLNLGSYYNESEFLVIPQTSGHRRNYIPIGFIHRDIISGPSLNVVPGAGLYGFGVLTSLMHNAWMRVLCGRLGNSYRYSIHIIYNTFPWPESTEAQRSLIEDLSQKVLKKREDYGDSSLGVLYSFDTMPPSLNAAHKELDVAIDNLYRNTPFKDEDDRFKFLLKLYKGALN